LSVTESDLRDQLENLDWGVPAPTPAPEGVVGVEAAESSDSPDQGDPLAIDVAVPGVKPARVRKARTVRVRRQPNAQALLDATRAGQTVAANEPSRAVGRRGRNVAPDVLVQAGEGPAVIALFDAMWKDVGSKLARSIGRAKASRQDAAIGWYALLLAMRERDAAK
jgi:hypothetical protein